jgi:ribonuclease HI
VSVLQNLSIDEIPASGSEQLVLLRTPVIGWMEANTDGSVTNGFAACGGLFRDYMANFHGGYAKRIGIVSVLHVELIALIIAMELANSKGRKYLWLESDSLTALRAFDNIDLVPWDLHNH